MRLLSLCIFSLVFLVTSLLADTVMVSLAPVIDHSVLPKTADALSLRNATIAELTEGYDCVVLSRNHGDALMEEQRLLALNSLNPAYFPYPPAADYVVVIDLQKSTSGPVLRLTFTTVTGRQNSAIETANIRFASVEELIANGADAVGAKLAELFELKPRIEQAATKAMYANKVWAVIPWVDYSAQSADKGPLAEQLTDESASILERVLPDAERLAPEAVGASKLTYFAGASETQAAALGNDIGADYLLAGSIRKSEQGVTLYAFVVRSQDAVVLAGREMLLTDEALPPNFDLLIESLIHGLPELPPLKESAPESNIEEAKLLYDLAENARYAQALELILAARMVAQDTYMESVALRRIPTVMIHHPNKYYYADDWRTRDLRPGSHRFNDYVLDILNHTLPQPHGPEELSILMHAHMENGDWPVALDLHDQLVAMGELNPRSYEMRAADYIRLLSLTEQFDKASAFYESLKIEERGEFTYTQAANNYRRLGQDEKELAAMIEKLETGNWRTVSAFERLCDLMDVYIEPTEQLRLIGLFHKRVVPLPRVQWQMIKAELALGREQDAITRAQLLLAQEKLDSAGFESEAAFRSRLKEIVGDVATVWPTAASLRIIPPEYKMYVQPVGEYDDELLASAVAIASEFFGCEIVIRPAIAPPPGRTAYHRDLTEYNCLPLLRHLTAVRPIPKDAIAQVYYVDRRFLVYGRGPTHDVYRLGLGTMISPIIVTQVIEDPEVRNKRLAVMIIRQFRYYIERSQGISLEDSPDNKPCINASVYVSQMPEFGYCPACVESYQAADFKVVFEFAQANPLPIVYTKNYPDRPKFSSREKQDIEAYMKLVGPSR